MSYKRIAQIRTLSPLDNYQAIMNKDIQSLKLSFEYKT